jgi:hypothetical protein
LHENVHHTVHVHRFSIGNSIKRRGYVHPEKQHSPKQITITVCPPNNLNSIGSCRNDNECSSVNFCFFEVQNPSNGGCCARATAADISSGRSTNQQFLQSYQPYGATNLNSNRPFGSQIYDTGLNSQSGYNTQTGFNTQPYNSQTNLLNPQQGYNPSSSSTFGTQTGYNSLSSSQTGYNSLSSSQTGYNPLSSTQTGYNSLSSTQTGGYNTQYGYNPQSGYNSQSGYNTQYGYNPQSGYTTQQLNYNNQLGYTNPQSYTNTQSSYSTLPSPQVYGTQYPQIYPYGTQSGYTSQQYGGYQQPYSGYTQNSNLGYSKYYQSI